MPGKSEDDPHKRNKQEKDLPHRKSVSQRPVRARQSRGSPSEWRLRGQGFRWGRGATRSHAGRLLTGSTFGVRRDERVRRYLHAAALGVCFLLGQVFAFC